MEARLCPSPSQKKMKELVVTAEMVVNRRVVFPLEKAG